MDKMTEYDFHELKQLLEENGLVEKDEASSLEKCENCSYKARVELEDNYLVCYDCGCKNKNRLFHTRINILDSPIAGRMSMHLTIKDIAK